MNYDKMNQAYDHYVTKYGQQQNYVINFKTSYINQNTDLLSIMLHAVSTVLCSIIKCTVTLDLLTADCSSELKLKFCCQQTLWILNHL